ncbi:MAG: hypothetical protein RLZZ403_193 [Pseudomonadota bacterium]|jgi:hypothetical protein
MKSDQLLRVSGPVALASALLLAACSQAPAPEAANPPADAAASASAAPPINPAISFNVLMVKFVDQAADPVWTAAVEPPKTDAEWETVEYHATQLAVTGTLMRVGGTGPKDMEWTNSPGWASFTDKMTEGALAAVQAAKNKDLAALQKAGDDIVLNCEGCHREFKLDLPTEGLATHLTRGIITEAPKPEAAQ